MFSLPKNNAKKFCEQVALQNKEKVATGDSQSEQAQAAIKKHKASTYICKISKINNFKILSRSKCLEN